MEERTENHLRSEIGFIVHILYYDLRPKKRMQLRNRLAWLCAQTHECESLTWEPRPAEPAPVPYEIEMGLQ